MEPTTVFNPRLLKSVSLVACCIFVNQWEEKSERYINDGKAW